MKRLLILSICAIMLCSFVLAQEIEKQPRTGAPDTGNKMQPALISAEEGDAPDPETLGKGGNMSGPVMMQGDTLVHIGLNNALQNVKNENAREMIMRNMQRFLERYQARLGNMSDVEVEVDEEDGEVKVKEKKEVKFFGFIRGKATKTYKVDKNGQIREKHPWYRFMYKETE